MSDFDIRELSPEETELAFEAMHALRPHVESADEFVERVNGRQRGEGFRLVAALPAAGGSAAAVAGFRTAHSLAWGFYLYVDDLSTVPKTRGRGLAGRLMVWLQDEAARLGCDSFQLDSAFGPQRTDAHRLYFNQRLAIAGLHFSRRLGE
jgi:GNAT superfamily N-acetyltransferase